MEEINPEKLIFIDESGSDTISALEHGRIEGGARLKSSKPAGTWEHFSIIGAISVFGIIALTYVKHAVDSNVFLFFIKNCLLKKLKKGQIVFLDNAKIHKNEMIEKLVVSTNLCK